MWWSPECSYFIADILQEKDDDSEAFKTAHRSNYLLTRVVYLKVGWWFKASPGLRLPIGSREIVYSTFRFVLCCHPCIKGKGSQWTSCRVGILIACHSIGTGLPTYIPVYLCRQASAGGCRRIKFALQMRHIHRYIPRYTLECLYYPQQPMEVEERIS